MAAAFIDYYDIFHLERSMSEKEIKKKMTEWSIMLTQMDGSTDPSNIAEKKQLREKKECLREARKILFNAEKRKQYDMELDAALRAGQVNHQKTREIKDALERARRYFEQQHYTQAIEAAREAIDNHANTDEPYEIISRSQFMEGDYTESLETLDQGAEIYQGSQTLWWLRVRMHIRMEQYEEAQILLNRAREQFRDSIRFEAEQAYLYFHAEKSELGNRTMETYLQQHPSDSEYRQQMAYNLIELSNYCYRYDTESQMQMIIDQKDYDRCLELVRAANRIYQDDYTKAALEDVRYYGERDYDEESKVIKKTYMGISAAVGLIGLIALLMGSGAALILLAVAALFLVFQRVIDKNSYLPRWQLNRDYYRGYKETGDGWLYALAVMPFDMAFNVLQGK